MTSSMDPLRIRRVLGRDKWAVPEEMGPDGWLFLGANESHPGRVIVTCSDMAMVPGGDRTEWLHASISRPEMPTYEDMTLLHRAVFGKGYAYQVFAPPSDHVNIHATALHLWGRLDGKPVLPEFGALGTI